MNLIIKIGAFTEIIFCALLFFMIKCFYIPYDADIKIIVIYKIIHLTFLEKSLKLSQ